jgi:beta-glucosidase-like glycosyl hydrolase
MHVEMSSITIALHALLKLTTSAVVAQQNVVPAYKNTSLSFEERAHDLEQRMTLEEKVSQLGHTSDAMERPGIPEYNWWNEGLHGVARAGVATVFPQAIGLTATFDDALIQQDADVISTSSVQSTTQIKEKTDLPSGTRDLRHGRPTSISFVTRDGAWAGDLW